jgi:hypothetical protein
VVSRERRNPARPRRVARECDPGVGVTRGGPRQPEPDQTVPAPHQGNRAGSSTQERRAGQDGCAADPVNKDGSDPRTARRWPKALPRGPLDFVRWYNVDRRHSGIRYVSPAQRHAGDDHAILAARHEPYVQAGERKPARWWRETRNWTPIGAVTLNPERDSVVAMASAVEDIQPLAA